MDEPKIRGKISFVNHEKQYATIEYEQNGRKKSVNYKIEPGLPSSSQGKKITKKLHKFRIGDEVDFQVRKSDRGDRMIAYDVRFLYNQELEKLISRASVENRFSGYLKMVDDQLFVKEWDSYIFFPLKLSGWENPPAESAFNEAISFKLVNLDKPNAIAAELFSHDFIPEYRKAVEHFKNKKPIEANVTRVSPFGIHLDLFGDQKIEVKIPARENSSREHQVGEKVTVTITYLSTSRIVVEYA